MRAQISLNAYLSRGLLQRPEERNMAPSTLRKILIKKAKVRKKQQNATTQMTPKALFHFHADLIPLRVPPFLRGLLLSSLPDLELGLLCRPLLEREPSFELQFLTREELKSGRECSFEDWRSVSSS